MVTNEEFRELALSFAETNEQPHFERRAFRGKGRIFATLLEESRSANLMFTPELQYIYTRANKAVTSVPGGWGRMGATTVNLTAVPKKLFREMMLAAYETAVVKTKRDRKT